MSELNTNNESIEQTDTGLSVSNSDDAKSNASVENQGDTSTNVDQGTSHDLKIGQLLYSIDGESTSEGHKIPYMFLGHGDDGKILVVQLRNVGLVSKENFSALD